MASAIFRIAALSTGCCAAVACIALTINAGLYVNNIYVKKTGENDTTKAEKYMAMVDCCLMTWQLIGHVVFKKLSE